MTPPGTKWWFLHFWSDFGRIPANSSVVIWAPGGFWTPWKTWKKGVWRGSKMTPKWLYLRSNATIRVGACAQPSGLILRGHPAGSESWDLRLRVHITRGHVCVWGHRGVEVGYNAQVCTDLQIGWKRGFWPFLGFLTKSQNSPLQTLWREGRNHENAILTLLSTPLTISYRKVLTGKRGWFRHPER